MFFTLTLRKRVGLDGAQEGLYEGLDGMRGAAHYVKVDGLSEVRRWGHLAARVLGGRLGQAETQQQGYGTGPERSAGEAHRVCRRSGTTRV